MSMRVRVEEALYSALGQAFPTVRWRRAPIGVARVYTLEGAVTCTRIEYEWLDKLRKAATASYTICLTDVTGTGSVDALADEVIEHLSSDRTLGGLVFDSICNEVVFDAAQGQPDARVAVITFTATYDA